MADDSADRIPLLSDRPCDPCDTGGGDRFGLGRRFSRLLAALKHARVPTPLCIALTGDWGTGKTFAMNWLAHELEEGDYTCVQFKPWKYHDRESVLQGLIFEVVAKLVPRKTGTAHKAGASVLGALSAGVGIVKTVKTAGGEEVGPGDLPTAAKNYTQTAEAILDPSALYLERFEKALKETLAKRKDKKRLCILVDDLDRCLPGVALQILEAIKLYFDHKDIVFIVGVDRDVVDRMLVAHYREKLHPEDAELPHVDRKARQYLNKIFQAEMRVPPSDEMVRAYTTGLVGKLYGWHLLDEGHQNKFLASIGRMAGINPRAVVRALNAAMLGSGDTVENLAKAEDDKEEDLELLLAQHVQRELVATVLGGLDPSGHKPEVVEAVRRHEGREFFRAWSAAVQGEGKALWLTEADLAPDEPEQRPTDPQSPGEKAKVEWRPGGFPIPADREDDEGQEAEAAEVRTAPGQAIEIAPLLEVFARHSVYNPLLLMPVLGELMAVCPFLPAAVEAVEDPVEAAFLRLVALIAENERTTPEAVAAGASERKEVKLVGTAKDADLAGIARFPALRRLNVRRSLVGDDGLAHLEGHSTLEELDLQATKVGDDGLAYLKDIQALRELDLESTRVGNGGLAHLEGRTSLQVLYLAGTRVENGGLAALRGLSKLQRLGLEGTSVGSDGLAYLEGRTSLKWLDLDGTQVDDAGLAHLKSCSNLEWLDLQNTFVGNDGLAHLTDLAGLEHLDLEGTQVGNDGLAHLNGRMPLLWLDLRSTGVENQGLQHLAGRTLLRRLLLEETLVTRQGVEALRRALPRCEISWDGDEHGQ